MTTNTELLGIAEKYLGFDGSIFRNYCGLKAGQPYCNAYVCYVAHKGGVDKLYFDGKKETYCPHSYEWCKKNLAQIPPYLTLPMDIVYCDWQPNNVPDHICFSRGRRDTNSIYTIEGNTSKLNDKGKVVARNVVAKRIRAGKNVQAIFRPQFKPPKKLEKKKLECDGYFGWFSIYNLQLALGMVPTGILTKGTVMILQEKAGAEPDGWWGPGTSKKIQKMVGAKVDGKFGKNSISKLQSWINSKNYPAGKSTKTTTKSTSKKTTKKETKTVKKTTTKKETKTVKKPTKKTEKKGYTGKFPTLNNNEKIVNGLAHRYCYPYGTPQKKYKFNGGKPKPEYTAGIDKAYPNHKNWPNKRQKVGACCDILVGTCLGNVGIKVHKDLKHQLVDMPKMTSKLESNGHYKASDFRLGDVVQRGRKDKSGHTWIVCELIDGTRYIANAHYKHLKGCYAVMDAKPKTIVKSKWKYYKCYTVKGAIRTWYQIGDYGYDVLYIQKFLKWAGYYDGKLDGGYGEYTKKCVAKFQKAVGLKGDGCVGELTIKKMKAVRK